MSDNTENKDSTTTTEKDSDPEQSESKILHALKAAVDEACEEIDKGSKKAKKKGSKKAKKKGSKKAKEAEETSSGFTWKHAAGIGAVAVAVLGTIYAVNKSSSEEEEDTSVGGYPSDEGEFTVSKGGDASMRVIV